MNPRERLLALIAVSVVIAAGAGFLFKFLFLDALSAVNAQITVAETELATKESEMVKQGQDRQKILHRDPRLAQWQHLSLPEDKNQDAEVKKGRPLEEVKKRHEDSVQVQYERFLTDLVTRSGFTPSTIKVSSSPVDRKGAPLLTPKIPAYTRMSFTVQGQSNLGGVVRMMEDFEKTPLLHEVRTLTLTSRAPTRSGQPGAFRRQPGGVPGAQPGGVPGAAPGGFPGAAPGGFPGAAPGGFPGAAPGGFPGAAPGGFPGAAPGGFPGAAPGGFPGAAPGGFPASPVATGQTGGDLDVNITVEALLVTGAEKRESLLPDGATVQAHILADPPRKYNDILAKNMFTGIASDAPLTEFKKDVLAVVKLTSIWNNGKRWQATYYDQGKGGDEKRLKPPILDEFTVADKYGNELVKGKALRLDEAGLIFQANEKIYRWRCGEFLGPVLDNPMKSDEIKELGL